MTWTCWPMVLHTLIHTVERVSEFTLLDLETREKESKGIVQAHFFPIPQKNLIFPGKSKTLAEENARFLLHNPLRFAFGCRRTLWLSQERKHRVSRWRRRLWIIAHPCWLSQPQSLSKEKELVSCLDYWNRYAFLWNFLVIDLVLASRFFILF